MSRPPEPLSIRPGPTYCRRKWFSEKQALKLVVKKGGLARYCEHCQAWHVIPVQK
jgi:hypothetical protein